MDRDRLFRRWHRQYEQLLKRQDRLLQESQTRGLPRHIHDLRVTLRRLRLMVRVSAPLLDRPTTELYRRWARKITDATSNIRDFDVILEWLASQPDHQALSNTLKTRRQRLWKMSRRHLVPPPLKVQAAIHCLQSSKRGRQRLRRRYPTRFNRLHARVVAHIPHFFEFDETEQHAFRRSLRMLRYLREFALTRRQLAADALLQALVRPQTAIGEYQNILLARRVLGALTSPALPPALHRALLREEARRHREIKASLRTLERIYQPPLPAANGALLSD